MNADYSEEINWDDVGVPPALEITISSATRWEYKPTAAGKHAIKAQFKI